MHDREIDKALGPLHHLDDPLAVLDQPVALDDSGAPLPAASHPSRTLLGTLSGVNDEIGRISFHSDALASEATDKLSAWSAFGGAVSTGIAAAAAISAGVVAIRTLRATKRDSRDRSRPMVGALLVHDPHPGSTYAYLVVRNYGQSVAYDVTVRFEPEIRPTGTRSNKRSMVPALLSRYEREIPNIMPGVELRNLWFVSSGEAGEGKVALNDEPIPDFVKVTIRYSDGPNFWAKANNRYVDTFNLDMATLRGESVVTHSNDFLGLAKRSTAALESIAGDSNGFGPIVTQFASGAIDSKRHWGESNS